MHVYAYMYIRIDSVRTALSNICTITVGRHVRGSLLCDVLYCIVLLRLPLQHRAGMNGGSMYV